MVQVSVKCTHLKFYVHRILNASEDIPGRSFELSQKTLENVWQKECC